GAGRDSPRPRRSRRGRRTDTTARRAWVRAARPPGWRRARRRPRSGPAAPRARSSPAPDGWWPWSRPRRAEIGALLCGEVGGGGVLAELQRADVGDDRPAVVHGDLRRVVGHGAEAARDHVEQIARR